MLTTRRMVLLLAVATLILATPASAADTVRITFQHVEKTMWGNTRETENYIVEWNVTTTAKVAFPVDIEAYNNGTIDPESEDKVCFRLSTPENQGEVNFTVSGYLNVTTKGIIPISGYTDFHNTTSWPVTTPLGKWNLSYPIPVPVPIGAFVIVVTVKPTLFMNASVTSNTTVEGPATISPARLSWKTDRAVENVSVQSSAQAGDDITVVAKDFTYDWNASVTVDLSLEGLHLITSPAYWFDTPSLQADEEVTVSFNIMVIPEFTRVFLVAALCLAEAGLLLYFKKKVLAKRKPSPVVSTS